MASILEIWFHAALTAVIVLVVGAVLTVGIVSLYEGGGSRRRRWLAHQAHQTLLQWAEHRYPTVPRPPRRGR